MVNSKYAVCHNRGRISHERVAWCSKCLNSSFFFFLVISLLGVLWGTLRKEWWIKKSELVDHPCVWDDDEGKSPNFQRSILIQAERNVP